MNKMNILNAKFIALIILFYNFIFSQSGLLILNPETGSEVASENLLIAASLIGVVDIKSNEIELILNGENITEDAYIDRDMISCLIDFLEPGDHEVNVLFNGNPTALEWTFSTIAREPNVKYSGRIRSLNSMDRIDNSSLNTSKVTLDFKGYAYDWLSFNSKIKLTSQENILYQPRNIYGLNFSIKDYLKLSIGDNNPRISNFTLNGKRIRGLDAEFQYSLLHFRYTKGEINRSVQADLRDAYTYSIQTDEYGKPTIYLARSNYTFQQNVTSMRFSLGEGELFQWGLNFMKARDDTTSVNKFIEDAQILYIPSDIYTVQGLDSGSVYTLNELDNNALVLDGKDWRGNRPKDNIVLGTDVGINLFQKKIRFDAEFAFSLTNNNIWGGALDLGELDTLIDDSVDNKIANIDLSNLPNPSDYENFLIINSNLTPLVPIDINAFADDSNKIDLKDAIFSMPSLAYRFRTISNIFGNYLSLEFSQVGPEFYSFANPYLVKNKREWSIKDKLRLLDNRLMLTLGYKYQDDNILANMENIKNQATSSIGINLLPGPNLPTLNISYRSIDRNNGITSIITLPDSSYSDNRENTETANLMLNTSHRMKLLWDHSLNLTYVNITRTDEFKLDRASDFIDPGMKTKVFNFALSTKYNNPLRTNINITINSTELSIGPGKTGKQSFITTNLNGDYPFLKNKLLFNGGFSFSNGAGTFNVSSIGIKAGIRYRIFENLSFNGFSEFRSKETNGNSSANIIARAILDYNF